MKTTYNKLLMLGLVIAGSWLLTSCESELDKIPEAQVSDAAFWNTAADLELAANHFYFSLPVIETHSAAHMSDDSYGLSPNRVSEGSRVAPNTEGSWSDNYRLIRLCNNLIEKAGRVNNAAAVARFRGEAKFFRAWAYFELVKRYGDVPHILRTFDVDDPLTNAARTDRSIVLDTAYADLDFAIANLPTPSALPNAQYGRVTNTAAMALKAKIGLFEGTWNKFHSKGDPAKHLNIAIEASEAVMQSGQHALFTYAPQPDSSYFYLFQMAGEGKSNKENILVRIYGENITNSISFHRWVRNLENSAGVTPTRSLMDAYLYQDGLPLQKSELAQPQTNTLSEFQDRDPRLGMTVFNRNAWFISSLYQPTFTTTLTGYKARKYFVSRDWTPNISFVDNIIMRYAEVLLINAEAKFELNGTISDADLDKTINLLRARVNMPALTNSFVAANGLDMREEIRRERRVELALEWDHRYFDLLRWKTAEVELPKTVLGAKFFPNEHEGVKNPKLNPDGFVIVQDASTRKFDVNRDYLAPLPTRDLGLSKALEQNPNW